MWQQISDVVSAVFCEALSEVSKEAVSAWVVLFCALAFIDDFYYRRRRRQ